MNARTNTQRRWAKTLSLLLALGLVASACSGGADDSASEGDAESGFFDHGDSDAGDSGAAGGISEDAAEEALSSNDSEERFADEDDAMEDDSGDAEAFEESEDAMAGTDDDASAPENGFFGEDDDSDSEEDNTFADNGIRTFVDTDIDPLSTFALDVDTASYSIARQWLAEWTMPPPESVRVEEFVNSFDYDYPTPRNGLTVVAEGGPSPFDSDNVILSLGVQAEVVSNQDRPDASLIFVIDTSGSMDRQDRLGLVKSSLKQLVRELDRGDSVAIVTYSSSANVILEPTSVRFEDEIIDAIDSLVPDGSTNLEAGLIEGYDLANEAFIRDGINRVILASDGVANVGLTDPDGLVNLIRRDADNGIQLVTVGVGMGNFNDVVMETLADDGDGFYAYVDTEEEADKLFGDDLVSTLLTVAIDGKIQVEFDDSVVESYRLLGFENRAVLDDDFRNDEVDAGELGAGHQVTAVYELKLRRGARSNDRLGTAMLRWEDPDRADVRETRLELSMNDIENRWGDTSDDFRLAVTVAAFAEILRQSPFADEVTLDQVWAEAQALGEGELADMIDRADQLS